MGSQNAQPASQPTVAMPIAAHPMYAAPPHMMMLPAGGQMVVGTAFGSADEDSALMKTNTPARAVHSVEIGCIAHSIVLGIALGIQSDQQTATLLLIVFLIHQAMECLCLSSLIASLKNRTAQIFFIVATAVSMPIGIFIGIVIEQTAGDAAGLAPWTASIECIGGGMLVFCTFISIMANDIQHPDFVGSASVRWTSITLFIISAGAMSLLVLGELAGGGHAH